MIISFLICGIACWLIEFALRKIGNAAAVYRPRLVAMFGAALFLNVIFAVGFLCQPFVDAYVGGTLTQFIYDLQTTPFEYISNALGNTYILATIPTIPALVAFYLCRNFLVSVAWAATAAVLSFFVRFVVVYWSSRYSGSLGLSGLILVVGCALSCYLALALAYESERILRMFRSSKRGPGITMLAMAGFTSVLSILIPAFLYYVFVFPLAKQVDAKLADGNYIMLSGSTERPVHSQVLGDAYPFQPAISFQRAYLEEAAQLDLATQAPTARARVQLHIANVIRPSYSIDTSTDFRWVKGEGPSSYGGFSLAVLRFGNCTMRDITNLRHKLAEGKIGYNYDVGRSALLEYRA